MAYSVVHILQQPIKHIKNLWYVFLRCITYDGYTQLQ